MILSLPDPHAFDGVTSAAIVLQDPKTDLPHFLALAKKNGDGPGASASVAVWNIDASVPDDMRANDITKDYVLWIKWDGCADLELPGDVHLCGPRNVREVTLALELAFLVAHDCLVAPGHDAHHFPCPTVDGARRWPLPATSVALDDYDSLTLFVSGS